MPYNILTSAGSPPKRYRLINEVNAEIGDEFPGVVGKIVKTYGRRLFPLRWVAGATSTVTRTGVVVDARLSDADAKEAIISALREMKTKLDPKPNPPSPKPGPAPEPTPEPTVWFREETGNLFHRESHTGLEPAEFFAVRSDATSAGLTADGVCNA